MLLKERLETYKRLHDHEIERKAKMEMSIATPISIVVVLIGAIIYLIQHSILADICIPPYSMLVCRLYILLKVFLVLSFIAVGILTYYLCRVFWPQEYKTLPTPSQIDSDITKMDSYYKTNTGDTKQELENDFKNFLANQYLQCSDYNTNVNDRRSGFLYRAKIGMVGALVLILLSGIQYILIELLLHGIL